MWVLLRWGHVHLGWPGAAGSALPRPSVPVSLCRRSRRRRAKARWKVSDPTPVPLGARRGHRWHCPPLPAHHSHCAARGGDTVTAVGTRSQGWGQDPRGHGTARTQLLSPSCPCPRPSRLPGKPPGPVPLRELTLPGLLHLPTNDDCSIVYPSSSE